MKFDILHRRCIVRTEPHAAGGFPAADRAAPDLRMAREKRDERQEEEQEEEGESDHPEKGSQDQGTARRRRLIFQGFIRTLPNQWSVLKKTFPASASSRTANAGKASAAGPSSRVRSVPPSSREKSGAPIPATTISLAPEDFTILLT